MSITVECGAHFCCLNTIENSTSNQRSYLERLEIYIGICYNIHILQKFFARTKLLTGRNVMMQEQKCV